MKSILSCFAVAMLLGAAIPSVEAQQSVSLDFFYDNLAPYGSWQDVGDYGYCWQPYDVDSDWQPYSNGRWVYTDVGWTWDSSEPFGWAVYHYGRWANLNGIGWIWTPGTEWGPGWVSWRHSPRYVGWAPLPPEAQFLQNIGIGRVAGDGCKGKQSGGPSDQDALGAVLRGFRRCNHSGDVRWAGCSLGRP